MKQRKELAEQIKQELATSDEAVITALMNLYALQTFSEKVHETDIERNAVGFLPQHTKMLTRFAKRFQVLGNLAAAEIEEIRPKVSKYLRQLSDIRTGAIIIY